MIKKILSLVWDVLTSMQVTILLLALLMVLVFLCTFAQIHMGTHGAVEAYMRGFIVWWGPDGSNYVFPVFPGGALVGLLLTINLVGASLRRLTWSWAKAGLWIAHGGLILLFAGEFVTGAFQVDMRMTIEEGQTVNYIESNRESELAIIDVTDTTHDDVYSVPESLLANRTMIPIPGTPLTLKVHRFFPNAELAKRGPMDPPSMATRGVGADVRITERAAVTTDNDVNQTSAFIEPFAGGQSYGIWLVSNVLGAPQSFIHEGRTYMLSVRARREYLPFAITLKKFSHDVYAGTDIPKNFSSLVHLSNPFQGEERDALIYMNQPLRYAGRAFYQASYGKGDTMTVLQVVANPGWLLPYISCVLVTLGMLVHFAIVLRRFLKRQQEG